MGPDKCNPGLLTGRSKIITLGQKSITGMDRIRPAFARNVDDLVGAQIGLAGWGRSK
jgi:hypothetical protein